MKAKPADGADTETILMDRFSNHKISELKCKALISLNSLCEMMDPKIVQHEVKKEIEQQVLERVMIENYVIICEIYRKKYTKYMLFHVRLAAHLLVRRGVYGCPREETSCRVCQGQGGHR